MANRLNDLGTGKLEAPKLRPEIIIIRPNHNYREMNTPAVLAHIAWLKESIRQDGVKRPIDVAFTEGKVYLEAGECRLRAAQELRKEGWDGYIPCFAVRGDEAETLARSMIDNGGLTPTILEFGRAVQQLVNFGWELERVASTVPSSIATDPAKRLKFVRDSLALHQAPLAVKKLVREGVGGVKVSPALALSATKKSPLHAEEEIVAVASQAKSKGQKVAKRPKTAGRVTRARESALSRSEQLEKLALRMCDLIFAASDKVSPALAGAAQAWKSLYGK